MLYRTFPPNAQLWNGLGGKIEQDETPLISVRREIQEEAGIDLGEASSLFFAGIASWGLSGYVPAKGIYTYIARLTQQQVECVQLRDTPEGFLAWKPLVWVCDLHNSMVVSNIPRFLPSMLEAQTPYEYFYGYEREEEPVESFQQLVIRLLPDQVVLEECQGW